MIKLELEKLLAEKGRSFYWLAKEAQINHAVMSKLRHNRMVELRLDVLDRICETLDCEPGDVLIRTSDKKKKA